MDLRSQLLGVAPSAQHDAHQVDRILGAELFHDTRAMDLHGPKAYPHLARRFLAGSSDRNLVEHVDLTLRQQLPAGKPAGADFRRADAVAPTLPGVDGALDAAQ